MFNSNYKRCHFFNFISSMFSILSAFQLGIFITIKNNTNLYFAFIYLLIAIIFCIYGSKYFDKTYQLKKNAKIEFTKQNKNK